MHPFFHHLLHAYQGARRWIQHHPRWRRLIVSLLILGLGAAFALALRHQWQQLDDYALAMHWPWLAVAALLYPLSMGIQMWLWHQLVATLAGYDSLRGNLVAYNLVNLAKSLPGLAFHITGRLMAYEQRNVPARPIVKALAFEATLHPLVGLLCLGALLLVRSPLPALLTTLGGVALAVATLALTRWTARKQHVPPQRLARWGLWMLLTWLNGLFFFWAILQATPLPSIPLSLLDIWYLWLVGSMASYLATYFLGGLSILREITLTGLLGMYIPLPLAVVVVVWSRIIGLVSEVGWSALLLALLKGSLFLRTAFTLTPQKEK